MKNQKSVSFAEDVENDIVRHANRLAEQILHESLARLVDDRTSSKNTAENFRDDFHRTIQPQRLTGECAEEAIYEHLSSEIVAYVLKHALRTLKEEEELDRSSTERTDDDFIDLK